MKIRLLTIIFALGTVLSSAALAQDPAPDPERQRVRRPDLFRQLGLTPEQAAEIRELNRERRPEMIEAQAAMREAARALDDAIYADVVNEEDVSSRLAEFQRAQGEIARIRYMNELAIRRVLTPEQFTKFRELRRRFSENRQRMRQRMRQPGAAPRRRAIDRSPGI